VQGDPGEALDGGNGIRGDPGDPGHGGVPVSKTAVMVVM